MNKGGIEFMSAVPEYMPVPGPIAFPGRRHDLLHAVSLGNILYL